MSIQRLSPTRLALLAASASFAFLSAGAALAGDAAAGAEKAKAVCAACHGADGTGVAAFPDYPRLAGQRADYLVEALKQYKSGARKNPIMGGMAQPLSVKEIEDVAAWFASQSGPLTVIR
jgi:cytochrome c553